jgi:hypothetical protein
VHFPVVAASPFGHVVVLTDTEGDRLVNMH